MSMRVLLLAAVVASVLVMTLEASSSWARRVSTGCGFIGTRTACLYDRPPSRRTMLSNSIQQLRATTSSSSGSSSNRDSNKDAFDRSKFVTMQRAIGRKERTQPGVEASTSSSSTSNMEGATKQQQHVLRQQRVFDKMAGYFASGETVTPEIIPIYEYLAGRLIQQLQRQQQQQEQQQPYQPKEEGIPASWSSRFRILDVGCGSGVLHPFVIAAAEEESNDNNNIRLDITGVDLSAEMILAAQRQADQLLLQKTDSEDDSNRGNSRHAIHLLQSDILEYSAGGAVSVMNDNVTATTPPTITPTTTGLFDLIVANACFGNFYDPLAVLRHLSSLLRMNGCLVISHPLGSAFVRQLHEEDMTIVPHLLPTYQEFCNMTRCIPLQVLDFVDSPIELPITNTGGADQDDMALTSKTCRSSFPFYYASATRVRFAELTRVIRLRGPIDAGYGRGGKKLGFPTANLPSRLFQNALEQVQPGVYFGWALLEEDKGKDSSAKGRNVVHKAVVNVGYSPTFQGQENREKIVEAHLILESNVVTMQPPDFYNETMRLQLIGFIRPEIKFPNFAALIAQISADVNDARQALDMEPYERFQHDHFFQLSGHLSSVDNWVGATGGDARASWEFEDIFSSLQRLDV